VEGSPGESSANAGDALAAFLPEAAGHFRATPVTSGDGWVRREYAWGTARIGVTIARQPGTSYATWLKGSADYPPVALGIPGDQGSGFYDCADGSDACSAHIHMRSGLHVEVMSGGTASRTVLDDLLAGLPLADLAAR
jgi:hypothetical protein